MSTRAERQWLREECRKDRLAADAFLRACLEDRADDLIAGARMLYDRSVNGWKWWMPERNEAWRLAMREVAELPSVSAEIQKAFVQVWARTERLPQTVRDRHLMAKVLRIFMPGDYHGQQLTLFRGAEMYEWRDRSFGFSWSKNADHARKFADMRIIEDEDGYPTAGVLLRTVALPEAVLLVRPPDNYTDEEAEVVVDPFRLGEVTLKDICT
jgi:hypothetical protein